VRLHTRDDEEPDDSMRFIERDYWFYRPSCSWCGQMHHTFAECPNRPVRRPPLRDRVVSISNG